MAVKSLNNWLNGQRADITDLRAIESSILFDFKTLLRCFVGDTPYILKGFSLVTSGAIGAPAVNLQVSVDGSIVWVPTDQYGSFLRVEAGTANETLNSSNVNVVGSFSAGVNYIGIRFNRETDPTTNDLVSLWDIDAQTETTVTAPKSSVLKYQIVIDNTSFGDTAPIAVVNVTGSNVTSISNAKQNMYRLGTGGSTANINNSFSYTNTSENNLTITSNSDPNPFLGGDWEIESDKQWRDAVMTEFKKIKNSAFWYSNGSSLIPNINLSDLYADTAGSVLTGVGTFKHDDTTPGLLTWTSDIKIRSTLSPLTFTITAGNLTLSDTQIAYVQLVRNNDFQPLNTFTFTQSSASVTGSLSVSGISAGDWIKLNNHDVRAWAQVSTVAGNTITLTSTYKGATGSGKALKSTGTYTATLGQPDVAFSNSLAIPATSDVFWFAKRDDSAVPTASIESAGSNGATRTSNITTIITTAAHGFNVGQGVSVSGVTDTSFNGTFEIASIPTTTSLTFHNPGSDVVGGIAGSGSISSRAKVYLRALGELTQGEERQIDDNAWNNVMKFTGMRSETDTQPPYTILPNALSTHTFSTSNDLTEAISAITGNVNDILTTLDQPSYDEYISIVSPPYTVMAQNLSGTTPSALTNTSEWAAQSFIPTISGIATKVTVELKKTGLPVADVIVSLYTDSGSAPGTLIESAAAFPMASLTTSLTTYDFIFSTASLTASTTYWIVVNGASPTLFDASNNFSITTTLTNTYASGNISYSLSSGASWTPLLTSDMYFAVYTPGSVGTNELAGPVSTSTVITIPVNSRLPASPQQYYVVSKGTLEVFLNGQYLTMGATNGWTEVGASLSNSDQITINQQLEVGDILEFRLDATGGPGSGGSSAPDDNFIVLAASSSADNSDYILIYDVSLGGYRKQLRSVFLSGLGNLKSIATKTANYTANVTTDDVLLGDSSSGSITITLPSAASSTGKEFNIKKISSDANTITIDAAGSETIDGALTVVISTQYASYTIVSDGSAWYII